MNKSLFALCRIVSGAVSLIVVAKTVEIPSEISSVAIE